MRLAKIAILGMIVVSLFGCKGNKAPDVNTYVLPKPWITQTTKHIDGTFTPIAAKFKFDGLGYDEISDRMPSVCAINPDYPDYKWTPLEHLNIGIHNRYSENVSFQLALLPTTQESIDGDTGIRYAPTPEYAKDWIFFNKLPIEATAGNILHLPVSIITSTKEELDKKGIIVPKRWEFDIQINDLSQSGMFHTSSAVRFLVTMRDEETK